MDTEMKQLGSRIRADVFEALRELSKHDAPRVVAFLDKHGADMKPFARKEAARKLPY